MNKCHLVRAASLGIVVLIAVGLLSTTAEAQTAKIQGLIKGRSGANMIVQTADSSTVVVQLTDSTQVSQVQGVLKARRKEMSMAALIPGLAVQVEGTYNVDHQLVAGSVKFKGDDLARAKSIQAGLHETQTQVQQNKEELERHNAELQAQAEALKGQQGQLAAQQEKIAANKAKIDAAVARFGQLDDYYILDEVTIYFGNGKVALEPKYKTTLTDFAQKAKTVEAYMIQIVGYASASGSEALNQKLSDDRASNVANFLLQQCRIPLTNIMAPGAMGESEQVGDSKTAEGEAQNRRVVVRVLQNKGIAGLASMSREQ